MTRMVKMLDGSELGPALVQLVDGEVVASDAEAWRHETEARAILNLPTIEQRRAWLADLERSRGIDAVNKLRDTMRRLHEASRP